MKDLRLEFNPVKFFCKTSVVMLVRLQLCLPLESQNCYVDSINSAEEVTSEFGELFLYQQYYTRGSKFVMLYFK